MNRPQTVIIHRCRNVRSADNELKNAPVAKAADMCALLIWANSSALSANQSLKRR